MDALVLSFNEPTGLVTKSFHVMQMKTSRISL